MPTKLLIETVRETMHQLMEKDERIILMGEDVGKHGGVLRTTDGLWKDFGDQRVIDTPLAESSIVGAAIGASFNGLLPIAEIQFSDFIMPAFNEIVSEAARIRYRSNNNWNCPIVIRAPYGGGIHGALYHSQSPEAFFAHVPGLKVVATASPKDLKGLLRTAVYDPDPVMVFEHKKAYRLIKEDVPDEEYEIPLGQAEIKRAGDSLSIITYGMMTYHALTAAEKLAADDINVEVLDLRTLRPLDTEAIYATVQKTGKVLIVHEDNITGGIGGEIAALIAQHCFSYLDGPIVRLCGPDVPAMGFNHVFEEEFLVNPERIEAAVRKLAAY